MGVCFGKLSDSRYRCSGDLAWENFEVGEGNCDVETLLEDVDFYDDTFGVFRIIDNAFESFEGTAQHAHGGPFFEERMQGSLKAGADDALHIGELVEELDFVFHGERAHQKIQLVNPGFPFGGNTGEDVAGEKGLGVGAFAVAVAFYTGEDREVVRHALSSE